MKGDEMKRRKGLMSIGIAIIMLLFSLIAAMVISNISSNLYKNIIVMDEGKELQYRRIVVMSLKNAADEVHATKTQNQLNAITVPENLDFTFALSKDLVRNPQTESFPATVVLFPATATLAATEVFTGNATLNYFELYTKHENDSENYGIVVQYEKTP